jgi:hypothetical protein
MGKIRVSQLAEVAGVMRWSLRIEDRFFCCTLEEDGMLTIYHEGRIERLSGCSVNAATLPKTMRAAYALCGSSKVQEALTRLHLVESDAGVVGLANGTASPGCSGALAALSPFKPLWR